MAEKKAIGFIGMNERIAKEIEEKANEGALQVVVNKRVEAEVTRRAKLLETALDKYNVAKKDLSKIVPDVVTYGVVGSDEENSGAPIEYKVYSEATHKKRIALQRTIADFDIAIMKVFSTKKEEVNDGYLKLQKLTGGGGKPEQTEKDAD